MIEAHGHWQAPSIPYARCSPEPMGHYHPPPDRVIVMHLLFFRLWPLANDSILVENLEYDLQKC